MTKEMVNAMKQDKVKFFNVSSHIQIEFRAYKGIIEKYVPMIEKIFNNNLNGALVENDGLNVVIKSNSNENKDIIDILDELVVITFNIKEDLGKNEVVVVTINGESTVI